MRVSLRLVVVLWLVSGLPAVAEPVQEYLDPETGVHVFDASGENTDFQVPSEPREFPDVAAYLAWVMERFHGSPILGEDGKLIDVRGSWVLLGRPSYVLNGKTYTVRQPVLQTISGPFGFVVIGGEKYEMPLDEEPPPFEEIEPALYYDQIHYRRSCVGGPVSVFGDYCLAAAAFKHIHILFQSIGGTVDIAGRAIVAPSTRVKLKLVFRDGQGRPLRISTPCTRIGVALIERFRVGGIGIGEWGVFGNPLVDPTKTLSIEATGEGPQNDGAYGAAEIGWGQRFTP